MKGVIVSICIAVCITLGSAAYTKHMGNVSERLGEINGEVMNSINDEDYIAAKKKTEQLSRYLDDNRTVLAAIGSHEDLDKIEMNLSEMKEYISGEEKTDAQACCRVLMFLFEHLPKNYEMKLENIL